MWCKILWLRLPLEYQKSVQKFTIIVNLPYLKQNVKNEYRNELNLLYICFVIVLKPRVYREFHISSLLY